MSRFLPHLTVALLGFAPLSLGAKATVDVAVPEPTAVSSGQRCSPDDCPMPACCDGSCDANCEMAQSVASR